LIFSLPRNGQMRELIFNASSHGRSRVASGRQTLHVINLDDLHVCA
jgi:hypothetical protein